MRSTIMKIELDRDDLIKEVKDNFYGDTNLLIDLVSEGAMALAAYFYVIT